MCHVIYFPLVKYVRSRCIFGPHNAIQLGLKKFALEWWLLHSSLDGTPQPTQKSKKKRQNLGEVIGKSQKKREKM